MLTPTLSLAASATLPNPSSISQASPSLPPAVLAKGTTARTWSQVVGEAAHKKAASKVATGEPAAGAPRGSYKEEFPRYVGHSASSPIKLDDTSDFPDGNIPSFLLPLATNISSLGHILPRRDGLWAVEWIRRQPVFLTSPSDPFSCWDGSGSQDCTIERRCPAVA